MPAVDTSNSINQCDSLNKTEFPYIWSFNEGDDNNYRYLAEKGVLKSYTEIISQYTSSTKKILNSDATSSSSPFNLVKFLSGGGITNTNQPFATDYSQFKNIYLRSIVDNYFSPMVSSGYTFSTPSAPLLADNKFWVNGDDTISNPTSILGKMLKDGLLLKSSELYDPGSKTTLLYLLNLESTKRSDAQSASIMELEARNLKFMGAWLSEYCFYRARYEWLLKRFFYVYTAPATGSDRYTSVTRDNIYKIFAGQGTGPNQYSGTSTENSVTQQDLIKCMVYHLACLNTRMVDMRTLLGKIGIYYSTVQTRVQTAINNTEELGSNTDLIKKVTVLNDSAVKTQKYLTEQDFHKGVMEYNLEKNRYSNILLSFYAFLNIVAVAVIIKVNSS
jgi:hypothetical protein